MIKSTPILKLTSVFTVLSYLLTQQGGYASALQTLSTSRINPEIRLQNLSSLEIPAELGTLEKMEGSGAPDVILIQDAHGQYEAQKNTAALLDYLHRKKGINAIYLEGASGNLDPDRLRFFNEPDFNQKAVEILARESEAGGTEMFLIERHQNIPALGLENPQLYLQNLEAFQKVIKARPATEKFLERELSSIRQEAGQAFNPALKTFFKEWMNYESSQELPRFLNALESETRKRLGIDLNDPRYQLEWPQIIRFLELKKRELKLQPDEAQKELKTLSEWSQRVGMAKPFLEFLETLSLPERGTSAKAGLASGGGEGPSLRRFWESFYEAAHPLGFNFEGFPNLAIYEGYQILHQEMDAPKLFGEIHQLTGKIFEKLTKSEGEKELLERAYHYFIFKKLTHLQLTRKEFQELEKNQVNTGKGIRTLFKTHRLFYYLARKREVAMLSRVASSFASLRMTQGSGLTVLVTGGFHTEALVSAMKKQGGSYAVVSPHLSEISSDEKYTSAMTGAKPKLDFDAVSGIDSALSSLNGQKSETLMQSTWMGSMRLPEDILFRRTGIRSQIEKWGLAQGATLRFPRSEAQGPKGLQSSGSAEGRSEAQGPKGLQSSGSAEGRSEARAAKRQGHAGEETPLPDTPQFRIDSILQSYSKDFILWAEDLEHPGRPNPAVSRYDFRAGETHPHKVEPPGDPADQKGFERFREHERRIQKFLKAVQLIRDRSAEILLEADRMNEEAFKTNDITGGTKAAELREKAEAMKRRADAFGQSTTVIVVHAPTYLFSGENRDGVYHVGRRSVVYFPVRYVDSLHLDRPRDMEKLAFFLDRAQRRIEPLEKGLKEVEAGTLPSSHVTKYVPESFEVDDRLFIRNGDIAPISRRLDILSRRDAAEKPKREKETERLQKGISRIEEIFSRIKAVPGKPPSEKHLERLARLFDRMLHAYSAEGMQSPDSKFDLFNQTEILNGMRTHLEQNENLPTRDELDMLARLYGILAHLQENVGQHENALRSYKAQIDVWKEIQRGPDTAPYPLQMQEQVIRAFLKLGLYEDFQRELKVYLTGYGFPRKLYQEDRQFLAHSFIGTPAFEAEMSAILDSQLEFSMRSRILKPGLEQKIRELKEEVAGGFRTARQKIANGVWKAETMASFDEIPTAYSVVKTGEQVTLSIEIQAAGIAGKGAFFIAGFPARGLTPRKTYHPLGEQIRRYFRIGIFSGARSNRISLVILPGKIRLQHSEAFWFESPVLKNGKLAPYSQIAASPMIINAGYSDRQKIADRKFLQSLLFFIQQKRLVSSGDLEKFIPLSRSEARSYGIPDEFKAIRERIETEELLEGDLEYLNAVLTEIIKKSGAVSPEEMPEGGLLSYLETVDPQKRLIEISKKTYDWALQDQSGGQEIERYQAALKTVSEYYNQLAHLDPGERRVAYRWSLYFISALHAIAPSDTGITIEFATQLFHAGDLKEAIPLLLPFVTGSDLKADSVGVRKARNTLGFIRNRQAGAWLNRFQKEQNAARAVQQLGKVLDLAGEARIFFGAVAGEYARKANAQKSQIARALAGLSASQRLIHAAYVRLAGFESPGNGKDKYFLLQSLEHGFRSLQSAEQALLAGKGKPSSIRHSEKFYQQIMRDFAGEGDWGSINILEAIGKRGVGDFKETEIKKMMVLLEGIASGIPGNKKIHQKIQEIRTLIEFKRNVEEKMREIARDLLEGASYSEVEKFYSDWEELTVGEFPEQNEKASRDFRQIVSRLELTPEDLAILRGAYRFLKEKGSVDEIEGIALPHLHELVREEFPVKFEGIEKKIKNGKMNFFGIRLAPALIPETREPRHENTEGLVVFKDQDIENYAKQEPGQLKALAYLAHQVSPWMKPERALQVEKWIQEAGDGLSKFVSEWDKLEKHRLAKQGKGPLKDKLSAQESKGIHLELTRLRMGDKISKGYASRLKQLEVLLSEEEEMIRTFLKEGTLPNPADRLRFQAVERELAPDEEIFGLKRIHHYLETLRSLNDTFGFRWLEINILELEETRKRMEALLDKKNEDYLSLPLYLPLVDSSSAVFSRTNAYFYRHAEHFKKWGKSLQDLRERIRELETFAGFRSQDMELQDFVKRVREQMRNYEKRLEGVSVREEFWDQPSRREQALSRVYGLSGVIGSRVEELQQKRRQRLEALKTKAKEIIVEKITSLSSFLESRGREFPLGLRKGESSKMAARLLQEALNAETLLQAIYRDDLPDEEILKQVSKKLEEIREGLKGQIRAVPAEGTDFYFEIAELKKAFEEKKWGHLRNFMSGFGPGERQKEIIFQRVEFETDAFRLLESMTAESLRILAEQGKTLEKDDLDSLGIFSGFSMAILSLASRQSRMYQVPPSLVADYFKNSNAAESVLWVAHYRMQEEIEGKLGPGFALYLRAHIQGGKPVTIQSARAMTPRGIAFNLFAEGVKKTPFPETPDFTQLKTDFLLGRKEAEENFYAIEGYLILEGMKQRVFPGDSKTVTSVLKGITTESRDHLMKSHELNPLYPLWKVPIVKFNKPRMVGHLVLLAGGEKPESSSELLAAEKELKDFVQNQVYDLKELLGELRDRPESYAKIIPPGFSRGKVIQKLEELIRSEARSVEGFAVPEHWRRGRSETRSSEDPLEARSKKKQDAESRKLLASEDLILSVLPEFLTIAGKLRDSSRFTEKLIRELEEILDPSRWTFRTPGARKYAVQLSRMKLKELRNETAKSLLFKPGIEAVLNDIRSLESGRDFFHYLHHAMPSMGQPEQTPEYQEFLRTSDRDLSLFREILYRWTQQPKLRAHLFFTLEEKGMKAPAGKQIKADVKYPDAPLKEPEALLKTARTLIARVIDSADRGQFPRAKSKIEEAKAVLRKAQEFPMQTPALLKEIKLIGEDLKRVEKILDEKQNKKNSRSEARNDSGKVKKIKVEGLNILKELFKEGKLEAAGITPRAFHQKFIKQGFAHKTQAAFKKLFDAGYLTRGTRQGKGEYPYMLSEKGKRVAEEALRSEARKTPEALPVRELATASGIVSAGKDNSILEVSAKVTNKILASDLSGIEKFYALLFPEVFAPKELIRAKEREKLAFAYAQLLSGGAAVVIPAQLLLGLSDQARQEYLALIYESVKSSPGSSHFSRIIFAGEGAGKLKEKMSIDSHVILRPEADPDQGLLRGESANSSFAQRSSPSGTLRMTQWHEVFQVKQQKELLAARDQKNRLVSVSFMEVTDRAVDSRIPALLLPSDEIERLSGSQRFEYLNKLTQLQLLAAQELKEPLKGEALEIALIRFLRKLNIEFDTQKGFLSPSTGSLLAADLTQAIAALKLTSQAA